MSLRLSTGAEANAGDAVAALDSNTVGGEGPLVGQGTALTLSLSDLGVGAGTGVAEQCQMCILQSLDVCGLLLVDPSGEVALGLVDFASPGGTIVHVHGNDNVVTVLLDVGQITDLLQAGIPGLASGHTTVDGDGAGVSNSAARGRGEVDLRSGASTAAQETSILVVVGVVLGIQHLDQTLDLGLVSSVVLVQSANVLQDVSHLVDSVVAAVGSGAVAGNTLDVNTDLHTAAMATVDAAVGGLGGDNELNLLLLDALLGEVLVNNVLPAHAVAVLFLNGADDHDLVALGDQAQVLHDLSAVGSGSHAALLVGAAAAVDDLVVLVALVGIVGPVVDVADTDGIDVGVDSDDLVASAHPADDVAQAVELNFVVAQLLHLCLDALADSALFAGLRGMGNHSTQESGHVSLVCLSGSLDLSEVQICINHW